MQVHAHGYHLAVWAAIDEAGKAAVEVLVDAGSNEQADPYSLGYGLVHRFEYQVPDASES